jgi:acyl dehydratase
MDYNKLRAFPIPEVTQTYSEKDAMLYALSVGAAEHIADGTGFEFVSETRGLRCLPSFSVILGHPGFWVREPGTTIDWRRNVHAEEGFTLLRPLPPSGTIVSRTEIVDIVDKGAGKGALMYTRKTITLAASGDVLALCDRVQFLRGDGGYDGPSGPPRPAVPDPSSPPDHVQRIAVRDEQAFLYRLNGDPNPLHVEPELAKAGGFDRPILHGLCTFGMAATAVLFTLADGNPEGMRGFRARFTAPVFPGETLRIEIWNGGEVRVVAEPREAVVMSGGRAVLGAPGAA